MADARGVRNVPSADGTPKTSTATDAVWRFLWEGVLVADPAGHIVDANPAATRLLDMPLDALRGRHVHDALHQLCPQGHECGVRGVIEQGGRSHVTLRSAQGEVGAAFLAVHAVPHGLVATLRDTDAFETASLLHQRVETLQAAMRQILEEIARRRAAETRLQEAERRFWDVLSAIDDGIAILDTNGTTILANEALARMQNLRPDDMIGRHYHDTPTWPAYVEAGAARELDDMFERALRGEIVERDLVIHQAGGGPPKHAHVSLAPLHGSGGPITGVLASLTDKTDRNLAQRALVEHSRELERRVGERTRQLEDANMELETFMRAATHDLKAPLRGIAHLSELLLDQAGDLDEERQDLVERMRKEARRATRLVDGLLALALAGRAELNLSHVDLSALARETVDRLRAAEPERPVEVDVEDGIAGRGDPVLLATVLDNLIGNAWKYTARRPDARIRVSPLESGAPGLRVIDNGIGFDVAESDHLFKPFRRLPGAKEFAGTGIGLATVARIVQRHGGHVWADATPDGGATFSFTLRH